MYLIVTILRIVSMVNGQQTLTYLSQRRVWFGFFGY